MSDAANALQQGFYLALSADAEIAAAIGGRIFDHRQTATPMPYIVISEIVTDDAGPDTEEHRLTIEAWSDADGRKSVQALAARVKAVLHDVALVLAGAHLVNLQHRSTRVRRETKAKAFVAELTFRAVTEGIAD